MYRKASILMLFITICLGQTLRFKLVGSCPLEPDTWYDCYDVIVLDTFAFLANEDLSIINIAQPESPFVISHVDTSHSFRNAVGPTPSYMYAMGINGFASFDISNMQSPVFLDSIDIFLRGDLSLCSSYAYCTSDDGLHLFDVSVPETLQYLGLIDSTINAGRLRLNNNFLYESVSIIPVCSLLIFDISNPANPQKISSLGIPDVMGLQVSEPFFRDSLIYLSYLPLGGWHSIAILIVNVADPYNPFLLAESPDTGQWINGAYDLTISGKYAYATCGSQVGRSTKKLVEQQEQPKNVVVFDISDPTSPFPVWLYEEPPSQYRGIDSRADTIYFCDGVYFYIFVDTLWTGITEEVTHEKPKLSILQVYPNPFSDKINIYWYLESETMKLQSLSLNIYDACGRMVRQLYRSSMIPLNRLSWDGRDDGGKKIEGGVYFVILKYGQSFCVQQKVVLIK